MTRPRGQPEPPRPPRYSYRFLAFSSRLCEAAGVDSAIFHKPDPSPWGSHRERVKYLVPELRRLAEFRERLNYSELGYRVNTDKELANARRMEALADRGRMLAEMEEDALEAYSVKPVMDAALKGIVSRYEARQRIEQLAREVLEGAKS